MTERLLPTEWEQAYQLGLKHGRRESNPHTHDPLCRATYQRNTPPEHCRDCDLIHTVRADEKAKWQMPTWGKSRW